MCERNENIFGIHQQCDSISVGPKSRTKETTRLSSSVRSTCSYVVGVNDCIFIWSFRGLWKVTEMCSFCSITCPKWFLGGSFDDSVFIYGLENNLCVEFSTLRNVTIPKASYDRVIVILCLLQIFLAE